MNTEIQTNDSVTDEEAIQLVALKNQATQIGLTFSPNIGADTLRTRIKNHLNDVPQNIPTKERVFPKVNLLSHAEYLKEVSEVIKRDIKRLVRIRLTCMNPNKSQHVGEIFSVGSAKRGTQKEFVPFDTEDGWHVPLIIFNHIKERQYTAYRTIRGARGQKIRKGRLVPEFNVEVLPPLTAAEYKALGQRQAMARGADD